MSPWFAANPFAADPSQPTLLQPTALQPTSPVSAAALVATAVAGRLSQAGNGDGDGRTVQVEPRLIPG